MIRKEYPFFWISTEDNTLTFALKNGNMMAKVFVLEEDIFRILFIEKELKLSKTWTIAPDMEDIEKEGRDRMDLSPFSCPEFTFKVAQGACVIETVKLKVIFDLNGMKASWYALQTGEDILIAQDRRTQAYNIEASLGEGVSHYLRCNADEQYYGLGEKTGKVNRFGKRYKMMSVDPMGYDAETTDPLYKHIPFYMTRNMCTHLTFGIFYDNLSTSIFDLGNELDNYHGRYRYYHAEDGDLDYYFILGPDVKGATQKFSWLTGKTVFPPKWSLGYSGSTMTYTDAPDAQKQLQKFVEDCENNDIPCDSFQLSSGYTSIGNKRYVFNWNYDKIPTPDQMVKNFHNKGLKLCANIKPVLLVDHPMFRELEERQMFILDRTGKEAEIAQFWDELGAYIDFTNLNAFEWWKAQVKDKLLKYGIDSTWNDNNEYEIWDNSARANGFGESINIGQIRPLQPLLMMKASFEAQKEFDKDKRPYLISRSGCPGMQRYVQTWSGDNRTSWKTLKYNIYMGIGLSLSGIYNIGHDVGGFAGEAPEPELLVRWVQNGIFHPRFTMHSWNDDKSVNIPWMYPEVTPIIRGLIQFRTKITPYLYQLLYKAHYYYEPIIRPTFYNFEDDLQTFEENDDFMLGTEMLVASVVEKNIFERKVYLPKHEGGWYDYHSQRWYEGGQTINIPAPLEYTPLLIKGGSIIPVNDHLVTFSTKDFDQRGLEIFPYPGIGTMQMELYEDDGMSNSYKAGIFSVINIKVETKVEKIIMEIRVEGCYDLPYQSIRIYLPKTEARILEVNQKSFESNPQNEYEIVLPSR